MMDEKEMEQEGGKKKGFSILIVLGNMGHLKDRLAYGTKARAKAVKEAAGDEDGDEAETEGFQKLKKK